MNPAFLVVRCGRCEIAVDLAAVDRIVEESAWAGETPRSLRELLRIEPSSERPRRVLVVRSHARTLPLPDVSG